VFTFIRAALLVLLISAAALAHDISGKWIFHVETEFGSGAPTFVFKQAGEKISGTYSGTFGTADLTGTVTGDDIQFSFVVTIQDQKAEAVYKGKIASDGTMKGSVDLAGLGTGTWTGSKQ